MANNQYVNKVVYGNQTVMDISDTTANSADVIEGEVFYTQSGKRSVGILGDATQSTHGLMSTTDKIKLDGISGNVYTDYTVTIATTDWTLENGEYVYTWESAMVTQMCLMDVIFITDPETVLTGELSADKVIDGVQFVSETLPSGALTVKIRIIDSDTSGALQNVTTIHDGIMSAQDKNRFDAMYTFFVNSGLSIDNDGYICQDQVEITTPVDLVETPGTFSIRNGTLNVTYLQEVNENANNSSD